MADLLCGHWTFFRCGGEDIPGRCDLPQGHEGLHKTWYGPHESYSWAEIVERHERDEDG